MSDWIDDLQEKHVERKADEAIARQRHELATQATWRLGNLLDNQFRRDVSQFQAKFPGRLEGPMEGDGDFVTGTKLRTALFPLSILEFRISSSGQIDFKRRHRATHDAPWTGETGSILVKADFGVEPWFEYQGKKFLTVEEVCELLLAPIFEQALPK